MFADDGRMPDDDRPIKEGYVRIYEDHTGRWFTDYTQEQLDEMAKDPFMMILKEEIQKEINREIVEKLKDASKNG